MIRRMVMAGVWVCLAWAIQAEAQWGPRGGGTGRGPGAFGGDQGRLAEIRSRMEAMNALKIEAMWAVLSFGVGLTPEQLDPLRGPFGEMWSKRTSILEDASKGDKTDWGAIKDEFKDMNKKLEQKIEAILKEDQNKAFAKQMKAYEKMMPRIPSGGSGPPGGGFGPPGGGFGPPGGE